MKTIGRYQIEGEIGRGAMGVVYRGLDPTIGRTIAIKTINLGELQDPAERDVLRDRLFREAQSAGILSHPNIVTIFDIVEENGLAYVFMEFVNGPPLDDLLRAEPLPPKDTLLTILRQTANALDYAHRKGIVHRDVKPGNIMIHDREAAKITDFGVARIMSQQMTLSGGLLGTPGYMSPEQVEGSEMTGAVDQFSLAVIAYEILAGRRPFESESLPSLLFKICRSPHTSPDRINTTLSPAVEPVFLKAMAKNPEERYETCSQFISELEAACKLSPDWIVPPRAVPSGQSSSSSQRLTPSRPPSAQPAPPAQRPVTRSEPSTPPAPPTPVPQAKSEPSLPPPALPPPPTARPVTRREPSLPATPQDPPQRPVTRREPSLPAAPAPPPSKRTGRKASPSDPTLPPLPQTPGEKATPELGRLSHYHEAEPKAGGNSKKPAIAASVVVIAGIAGLLGWQTLRTPSQTAPGSAQPAAAVESVPPAQAPVFTPSPTPTPAPVIPVDIPPARVEAKKSSAVAAKAERPKTRTTAVTSLRIESSPPGAHIAVGNEEECTAPCSLNLPKGKYQLLAHLDGHRNVNRTVELPRDKSINVEMKALLGILKLNSTPGGATIIIDGKPRPEKTPALIQLPAGSYKLQIIGKDNKAEETVVIHDSVLTQRTYDLQ